MRKIILFIFVMFMGFMVTSCGQNKVEEKSPVDKVKTASIPSMSANQTIGELFKGYKYFHSTDWIEKEVYNDEVSVSARSNVKITNQEKIDSRCILITNFRIAGKKLRITSMKFKVKNQNKSNMYDLTRNEQELVMKNIRNNEMFLDSVIKSRGKGKLKDWAKENLDGVIDGLVNELF